MTVKLIDLQVLYGVAGAREQFERLVAKLIKAEHPQAKTVRVKRGDDGIDVYVGEFSELAGIDVFQCKYFPQGIGTPQQKQIRQSFKRVLNSKKFKVRSWTLCLPLDLATDEQTWFDTWKAKQATKGGIIEAPWTALKLEGLLCLEKNRGLKEAYFKQEHLTQIREMHQMMQDMIVSLVQRLQEDTGSDADSPSLSFVKRFEKELDVRSLSDPSRESFGKTRYSARQAWVKGREVIEVFPSTSIFFAWMPNPIVAHHSRDELTRWMDCNERRYEPCRSRPFIPSLSHWDVGKGFVWDDSPEMRSGRYCCRYLALEPRGWIEYGFYPGAEWEEQTNTIYYARIVGSLVVFLSLVRDLAAQFKIDTAGIGLGVTLKGTAKKQLLGVREEGIRPSFQTQPPTRDTLLFLKRPSDEDWTVDGVAAQAADEILEHWSYLGESWVGRPEFKDSIYEGTFFRKRFQSF